MSKSTGHYAGSVKTTIALKKADRAELGSSSFEENEDRLVGFYRGKHINSLMKFRLYQAKAKNEASSVHLVLFLQSSRF